jgi:hypothetical protein
VIEFVDETYGFMSLTKSKTDRSVYLTRVQVLQVDSMSVIHVSWDSESKVPPIFRLLLS